MENPRPKSWLICDNLQLQRTIWKCSCMGIIYSTSMDGVEPIPLVYHDDDMMCLLFSMLNNTKRFTYNN